MRRLERDEYYMTIARATARRSTCPRRSVGAILVRNGMVIATGYNGAARGRPHCTEVGCDLQNGHCVRTVHAEVNALLQAARTGVSVDGAVMYTTSSPCYRCALAIRNAGVGRILYRELYSQVVIDDLIDEGIDCARVTFDREHDDLTDAVHAVREFMEGQ